MNSAATAFQQAAALRAAGNLAESAVEYQRALSLAPTMAEAHLNIAWVLSELGRAPEAIHAYDRGLQLRRWPPDTAAAAYNNLGVLLRDANRDAEASAAFRWSLAARPNFAPAIDNAAMSPLDTARFAQLINAANELYARSANAEAASLYRQAIPLRDPRIDGAAYVGLGAALHGGRKLSEAKQVLVMGVRLNPASPGMLANLATVRTELRHWKGAADAWKRALTLTPTDGAAYRTAANALQQGGRHTDAIPLLAHACGLDPSNWHVHYGHAAMLLRLAHDHTLGLAAGLAAGSTAARRLESHGTAAMAALRPMHRLPISLDMRASSRSEPPWTRAAGRGLLGDEPPPKQLDAIWRAQAARRAQAAEAGRQRAVIVYKLGPKRTEIDNLKLSLTLLMRHHNRAFRYPVLIAHDEPLAAPVRAELTAICNGTSLAFELLTVELPRWLDAARVPETVLGFPIAYRHMIRWKVGLMWHMAVLAPYDYAWLLDTDAFLLGPLTYDVFGLLAARNATYGYVDVNVETPEVADGLADCLAEFLRSRPALQPTMLHRYTRGGRWDGSKFYTNFQVARLDFGRSPAYRALFEHIDRNGGIYNHRWGADPIVFLAVTILLTKAQVLHFDDVPYLHQHLVANLPSAVADELTLPAEFKQEPRYMAAMHRALARSSTTEEANATDAVTDEAINATDVATNAADRCDDGDKDGRGARADEDGSAGDGAAADGQHDEKVLLYISDVSHAAAGLHALRSYMAGRMGSPAMGRQVALPTAHSTCDQPLTILPCTADSLDDPHLAATMRTMLQAVPEGVALSPIMPCAAVGAEQRAGLVSAFDALSAILHNSSGSRRHSSHSRGSSRTAATAASRAASNRAGAVGATDAKAATAALAMLQMSAALRRRGGMVPRLLLICVDETDGRTMASVLAARLVGAPALNVCDVPPGMQDGGVTPLPGVSIAADEGEVRRLLESAQGCQPISGPPSPGS